MKSKKGKQKLVDEGQRSLQAFLQDEDGFVSRENILKVGVAVVAGIGLYGALSDMAYSGHRATHTDYMTHNVSGNPSTDDSGCVDTSSFTHSSVHTDFMSY